MIVKKYRKLNCVDKGKRIKRCLFKACDGRIINADVNDAYNILRKAIGQFSYQPIEACGMPGVLTPKSFHLMKREKNLNVIKA